VQSKNGDEIEKGVYLRLNQSIDVLVMPNVNVNEIEKNVKVIQIADDNNADWQELICHLKKIFQMGKFCCTKLRMVAHASMCG